MSEVSDMKKAIAEQRKQREGANKRITEAIAKVDQTRKAKRDESNHRH